MTTAKLQNKIRSGKATRKEVIQAIRDIPRKTKKQHLYIKIVQGQWYATDLSDKWLTKEETAKAIADGATYEFVS
jgi:hypothetical protein